MEKLKGEHGKGSGYFAKIPNDEEGRYFLHLLDKYLNHEEYAICKRGRTPDEKKLKKAGRTARSTWQGVPSEYATRFNLYLTDKKGGRITTGMIRWLENYSTYWSGEAEKRGQAKGKIIDILKSVMDEIREV